MRVVAFLPAKGQSRRIKSKNIKLLDGKPLFLHTLEKLMKCDFIDEVYLDSDSEAVFDLASEVDCKYLRRDPSLANNSTDGHMLMFNEAKKVKADIYIQILCTSPFIKIDTIRKGVEKLKNKERYDSIVLVNKEKQYLWDENGPLYNNEHIPNSNDLDDTIIETMGLYIVNKDVALNKKKRIGSNPYLLEAESIEAVDVNYPEDFKLASYIMAGKREEERERFRNLSKILTSAMLSDIMDDLNLDNFISGLKPNMKNKKIMGRAKTLKLRKLNKGEDFRGIYEALESYKTIVPNDIIVVENEISEYAYFGNLNANLAIKSGAVGAIIGGKTRDRKDVTDLDFPVFSTGNISKDVRKRATTESINKKVNIMGVEVSPGDLIFADSDGIIVLPKKYENLIIKKALKVIKTENKIISDILVGHNTNDIIDRHGAF
ncbi:cytidylyltransferase domain-containing protein [Halanaerobium praevalens]|uniref:Acylneuraminate cytidylyltransferase n=1 Tax=Halanaerobium praevalens (strain ATCC 33744 / DSM 2228 / GSL) TaxID=572479 RepID=E3DR06_HALPG|nr:cytidyltransferase [Halanaerobium praevalens]ADO77995.1 acylneuraminate cytidylyltransferase [Halanaerobium praevalens DSM 2228]